jgi:DNA-binding SARP family transcriptional activator
MFWNDTTTEQSMKNLRTALSGLQKQLADELLVDRQTIGVNPDAAIWLDVRHSSPDFLRWMGEEIDCRAVS